MKDVAEAKLVTPAKENLSKLLYQALYSDNLARQSIPSSMLGVWVATSNYIRLSYFKVDLSPTDHDEWETGYTEVKLPKVLPLLVQERSHSTATVNLRDLPADKKREVVAAVNALISAKNEVTSLESSLKRIVATCNTSKQLEETLPEAAKFLPDENSPKPNELSYPVAMSDLEKIRSVFHVEPAKVE